MSVHVSCGLPMREAKRQHWETRWCFKCRAVLPHDAVLMVPTEPSYYGPHWQVECEGCGEDHVRFPGTEDGPTLGDGRMTPPSEWMMSCRKCSKAWLRTGNTVTTCAFCGSVDTIATRIARVVA